MNNNNLDNCSGCYCMDGECLKIIKYNQDGINERRLLRCPKQDCCDDCDPNDKNPQKYNKKWIINRKNIINDNSNNYINNNNNNKNNKNNKRELDCKDRSKENCVNNNGCYWEKRSVECRDLLVKFLTSEGLNGVSYELPIGNYDLKDIEQLDFMPKYILVPFGLKVKIWKSPGYVGNEKLMDGNITPGNLDKTLQKRLMYKNKDVIKSMQICNMEECVKPSEYSNMKLISIIDGNNINMVEKKQVYNVEEYKNLLKGEIKMNLELIDSKYEDCVEEVIQYFKNNNIDINKDIDEIEELNTLQKIKYLIDTLPSCGDLNFNNPSPSLDTPIYSLNEKQETNNIEDSSNNILKENNKKNNQTNLVKNILIVILIFVILMFLILGIIIFLIRK